MTEFPRLACSPVGFESGLLLRRAVERDHPVHRCQDPGDLLGRYRRIVTRGIGHRNQQLRPIREIDGPLEFEPPAPYSRPDRVHGRTPPFAKPAPWDIEPST